MQFEMGHLWLIRQNLLSQNNISKYFFFLNKTSVNGLRISIQCHNRRDDLEYNVLCGPTPEGVITPYQNPTIKSR